MAARVLMWGGRRALALYHAATATPASALAAERARALSSGLAAPSDDAEEAALDFFIDLPEVKAIAVFFAFIAFAISMYLLYKHLQYYTRPLLQRQIVRIVFIIPVYAVCSSLSLTNEHYAHYIDTVRDVYEAYCIHCFLVLMLDFPGGEAAVVEGIKEKGLMKHPSPFCCCPKIALGADFIKNMKRTTLQFVVLKPLMALLSLITMWADVFDTPAVQYILLVVYNISYTTALYGLFLFYLGTKSLLHGFSPVGKFSAVKVIVFATYYQSLLVVMVPGMDELGGSEKWNNWFICFEMALFAVMHWYCFSYTEFLPGGVGVKDLRSQGFDEPMNLRLDTSWPAVRARISDVCNLQDTWEDLQRLFSRTGTDHIMLGMDGGIVAENTAQVVMDQAADAAAAGGAGKGAPPRDIPVARVRVVEEEGEGEGEADKDGLFSFAAPGSKMMVKMQQGVERIKAGLRLGGKKEEEGGGEDMYGSIALEGGAAPIKVVVTDAAGAGAAGSAAGKSALNDLMSDFAQGNLAHGLKKHTERPTAAKAAGSGEEGKGDGSGGAAEAEVAAVPPEAASAGYIPAPPALKPASNLAEKVAVRATAVDPTAASAQAAAELLKRLKAEEKGGAKGSKAKAGVGAGKGVGGAGAGAGAAPTAPPPVPSRPSAANAASGAAVAVGVAVAAGASAGAGAAAAAGPAAGAAAAAAAPINWDDDDATAHPRPLPAAAVVPSTAAASAAHAAPSAPPPPEEFDVAWDELDSSASASASSVSGVPAEEQPAGAAASIEAAGVTATADATPAAAAAAEVVEAAEVAEVVEPAAAADAAADAAAEAAAAAAAPADAAPAAAAAVAAAAVESGEQGSDAGASCVPAVQPSSMGDAPDEYGSLPSHAPPPPAASPVDEYGSSLSPKTAFSAPTVALQVSVAEGGGAGEEGVEASLPSGESDDTPRLPTGALARPVEGGGMAAAAGVEEADFDFPAPLQGAVGEGAAAADDEWGTSFPAPTAAAPSTSAAQDDDFSF